MLFWRSWFLLTESSSSEENEGSVSRFRFSSSSSLLQGLVQLITSPAGSPSGPSKPPGSIGGAMLKGGGAWEEEEEEVADGGRGILEGLPEQEATVAVAPGVAEDEGNVWRFPDFRKSRKEAMNPDFISGCFSSTSLIFCLIFSRVWLLSKLLSWGGWWAGAGVSNCDPSKPLGTGSLIWGKARNRLEGLERGKQLQGDLMIWHPITGSHSWLRGHLFRASTSPPGA